MKTVALIFGVIVAMSCSNAQKTEFSAEALNEKLTAADGSTPTFGEIISKHNGKPVMIEVWASWCSDCIKAMPKLKETQAAHPEVDYVFISMDKTPEKWRSGIEKHDLRGEHYFAPDGMKGAFGSAISLDWIPRYILIDKNGKVAVYRAVETDFETINKTLNELKK